MVPPAPCVHVDGAGNKYVAWLSRQSQHCVGSLGCPCAQRISISFIHCAWYKIKIFQEKFLVDGKSFSYEKRKHTQGNNSPGW